MQASLSSGAGWLWGLLGARQSGAGGAEWPFGLPEGARVARARLLPRLGPLRASWLGLGAGEGGKVLPKKSTCYCVC